MINRRCFLLRCSRSMLMWMASAPARCPRFALRWAKMGQRRSPPEREWCVRRQLSYIEIWTSASHLFYDTPCVLKSCITVTYVCRLCNCSKGCVCVCVCVWGSHPRSMLILFTLLSSSMSCRAFENAPRGDESFMLLHAPRSCFLLLLLLFSLTTFNLCVKGFTAQHGRLRSATRLFIWEPTCSDHLAHAFHSCISAMSSHRHSHRHRHTP